MTHIPERCPWCGEEENIRADGGRTGTYRCGAALLGRGLWGNMAKNHATCRLGLTPAARAYRKLLAGRKMLSQHTGVPLPLVLESRVNTFHDISASFTTGKGCYVIAQRYGYARVVIVDCGKQRFVGRHSAIQEACRRLLEVGVTDVT